MNMQVVMTFSSQDFWLYLCFCSYCDNNDGQLGTEEELSFLLLMFQGWNGENAFCGFCCDLWLGWLCVGLLWKMFTFSVVSIGFKLLSVNLHLSLKSIKNQIQRPKL